MKAQLLLASLLVFGAAVAIVYYVGVPAMVQAQTVRVAVDRFVSGAEPYRGAEFCKSCHAQEYEEWSGSLHAKTYTEAHFAIRVQELGWGMPEERCLSCHAPLTTKGRAKEEGVTCEVCHGPGMTRTVVRDICVRCHGMGGSSPSNTILGTPMEFEVSQAKEQGMTCVDCHMPKQGAANFHGFRGSRVEPDTYRGTVRIESITRRDNQIIITVKNLVAGHSLPTGAPENVIFLEVVGLDSQGQQVYQNEYRFQKNVFEFRTMPMWVMSDTRLTDGEQRELAFNLPASASRVSALVEIKPRLWNGEFSEFVIDQMEASVAVK